MPERPLPFPLPVVPPRFTPLTAAAQNRRFAQRSLQFDNLRRTSATVSGLTAKWRRIVPLLFFTIAAGGGYRLLLAR